MKNSINKDCFASGDKCRVLTATECSGCGFYKTNKQFAAERERSVERLKRLGLWEHYKGIYGLTEIGSLRGTKLT